MYFGAQSGSPSQHLFKKNTRFHSTHKYQCCNFWYIDTGCKQINSNSNTWKTLIFKAFDCLCHLLRITTANAASNLHNRIIVNTSF